MVGSNACRVLDNPESLPLHAASSTDRAIIRTHSSEPLTIARHATPTPCSSLTVSGLKIASVAADDDDAEVDSDSDSDADDDDDEDDDDSEDEDEDDDDADDDDDVPFVRTKFGGVSVEEALVYP